MRHALLLVLLGLSPAIAADPAQPLFAAPFSNELGPGWSWVREDRAAWRIKDEALEIRTFTGGNWAGQRAQQNILVRTPPERTADALAIEVLLDNQPTGKFEHAGLVWYEDDDNWVVLNKERINDKAMVIFVPVKATKPIPTDGKGVAYEGATVWLRMLLAGERITGQFRKTEKEPWQTIARCTYAAAGKPRWGS